MQIKLVKHDGNSDKEKNISMHKATVEEALSLTGFGKYNFGLLLVCSWTLQAMGMDLFGSSFVVAAAVCDLELTLQQRALLTAMPLVGVVMGAQVWGYIADTRGRRLTLMLSMSVGFVFAALSSLAPDWKTMAVLKLLSSTFTSASNSGAYTLLGESCSEHTRGKVMLLCTCALMCSQAVAAVFAYPILPLEFAYPLDFLGITYRPWRLLAFTMALPCAATAALLRLFHESPKFLTSRGRYEEALKVLKGIYATNTGDKADNFPVKKLQAEKEDQPTLVEGSFLRSLWQQTMPLFKAPLLKDTLKLFYLVTVIYMTGSGFILWLPYIMNNLFVVLESGGGDGMNLCSVIKYSAEESFIAGNSTDIEICNDTIQETTLLSAMTYGAIASSINLVLSLTCGARKRLAMMGILTMSATAAILLNLVKVPIAGGIFFFMFIMAALSMGILSVYFVELYPTSLRGMASCLSVMLGRSSAFVGVNAIGALISLDCEATFYGWSLLLISAIVFAWFLPRDKSLQK
ncbi:synaptic vesicle glycoprotein 2C-like [Pectinophora gossypiella]|uniref:synaptic vesicle glycoprotein 2C-like n=1 Tax=Pectinophora gossypiella TaxID=13191 RepID=UPI00214E0534|nr:synaptic vesicle glycoprotein 2C-like [Pectinophora gossypiella]